MRRLIALVALLTVVPGGVAFGAELDELLSESQAASYSAEQIISCSTPDGERDALVRIEQVGDELRVTSSVSDDVEVISGSGEWTLTRGEEQVVHANVVSGEATAEDLYTVEELGAVEYLGRASMAYLLIREGEPRAELVIDEETGAVVEAVTLTIGNEVYCERRFVSLDTDPPEITEPTAAAEETPPTLIETSTLPEEVGGFELLDQYVDEDGVRFAYYSDGFFSFAVFETPTAVALPGAELVEFTSGPYSRIFTAGQVTYVWETLDHGVALVGDLPPDMHEAVLAEMPHPQDRGLFRRWWRALFG